MLSQLGNGIGTICLMLLTGVLSRLLLCWHQKFYSEKPATMEDYLYKIARITGKSEYDVFTKSAEEWPISSEKIDEDFKSYLLNQSVPFYVRDYVRKNKPHIDELHLPKF